jgi:hypothetical protein
MDNTMLLKSVEKICKHFTIFSFDSGYKGMFGTPTFIDNTELCSFIDLLPNYKSIEELLYNMVENPSIFDFHNYSITDFRKTTYGSRL